MSDIYLQSNSKKKVTQNEKEGYKLNDIDEKGREDARKNTAQSYSQNGGQDIAQNGNKINQNAEGGSVDDSNLKSATKKNATAEMPTVQLTASRSSVALKTPTTTAVGKATAVKATEEKSTAVKAAAEKALTVKVRAVKAATVKAATVKATTVKATEASSAIELNLNSNSNEKAKKIKYNERQNAENENDVQIDENPGPSQKKKPNLGPSYENKPKDDTGARAETLAQRNLPMNLEKLKGRTNQRSRSSSYLSTPSSFLPQFRSRILSQTDLHTIVFTEMDLLSHENGHLSISASAKSATTKAPTNASITSANVVTIDSNRDQNENDGTETLAPKDNSSGTAIRNQLPNNNINPQPTGGDGVSSNAPNSNGQSTATFRNNPLTHDSNLGDGTRTPIIQNNDEASYAAPNLGTINWNDDNAHALNTEDLNAIDQKEFMHRQQVNYQENLQLHLMANYARQQQQLKHQQQDQMAKLVKLHKQERQLLLNPQEMQTPSLIRSQQNEMQSQNIGSQTSVETSVQTSEIIDDQEKLDEKLLEVPELIQQLKVQVPKFLAQQQLNQNPLADKQLKDLDLCKNVCEDLFALYSNVKVFLTEGRKVGTPSNDNVTIASTGSGHVQQQQPQQQQQQQTFLNQEGNNNSLTSITLSADEESNDGPHLQQQKTGDGLNRDVIASLPGMSQDSQKPKKPVAAPKLLVNLEMKFFDKVPPTNVLSGILSATCEALENSTNSSLEHITSRQDERLESLVPAVPQTILPTLQPSSVLPSSTSVLPSSTSVLPSSTSMLPPSTSVLPRSPPVLRSSTSVLPSSTLMLPRPTTPREARRKSAVSVKKVSDLQVQGQERILTGHETPVEALIDIREQQQLKLREQERKQQLQLKKLQEQKKKPQQKNEEQKQKVEKRQQSRKGQQQQSEKPPQSLQQLQKKTQPQQKTQQRKKTQQQQKLQPQQVKKEQEKAEEPQPKKENRN